MLATFGSFIGIYYLPLYYQFARGSTAMETSVHLLPFILFLVAFNLANGQFMAKTGYYYPWYVIGAALELIGGVLMCKCPVLFPSADEQNLLTDIRLRR